MNITTNTSQSKRTLAIIGGMVLWLGGVALAADVVPSPDKPGQTPPPRAEAAPPLDPSLPDSGMVKQPQSVPHPDSVVNPPVVDPKMAVKPDDPTDDRMASPPQGNPKTAPSNPPVPSR